MAAQDDDDVASDEGVELEVELDDQVADDEDGEPDPDELDGDEDLADVPDDDDDDDVVADEEEEDDDDEAEAVPKTRAKKRATGDEEEDEDDDLLSPDDVEADLDRILKDRMVTVEEEDDDEEVEPDERGEGGDRLQPKRADEQLCPSCFLLVRASAPACPVGDDDCPIFST